MMAEHHRTYYSRYMKWSHFNQASQSVVGGDWFWCLISPPNIKDFSTKDPRFKITKISCTLLLYIPLRSDCESKQQWERSSSWVTDYKIMIQSLWSPSKYFHTFRLLFHRWADEKRRMTPWKSAGDLSQIFFLHETWISILHSNSSNWQNARLKSLPHLSALECYW